MCKKHTRFLQLLVALKKTRPICITTVAFSVCMLLCACTNNVDSMIEDYNGHFVIDPASIYNVDNVVSDEMLRPYYAVSYLTTLCLAAPEGGASYDWTVEVYENANGIPEGTVYTVGMSKDLILYIKDSSVKRWGSYKLILTVEKNNAEVLKDEAWLYVY